jgi:hypothetical protein
MACRWSPNGQHIAAHIEIATGGMLSASSREGGPGMSETNMTRDLSIKSGALVEGRIDALIEAGWHVLETDFDDDAFLCWRMRAYECLKVLLGPSHHYTEHFRSAVKGSEATAVLTGVGFLEAASLTDLQDNGSEPCVKMVEPGIESIVRY